MVDVNILVYAHREDSQHHEQCHQFLTQLVNGTELFGMAGLVLSGFIRVVTHPKIFNPPSPLKKVVSFVKEI